MKILTPEFVDIAVIEYHEDSQSVLFCHGQPLEVKVLRSGAGFYIGTFCVDHGPVSRISQEYYPTAQVTQAAFENGSYTLRTNF